MVTLVERFWSKVDRSGDQVSTQQIAERLGVHARTVRRVLRREVWSHLDLGGDP